ncbi:MAG: hypothetical protein INR69_18685 [Mucilaginibacter polytrichastri]|nr:hypothetical protein [Mucilaginibacter polytrichastri]
MTQVQLLQIVSGVLCIALIMAIAALFSTYKKFNRMIESDQKTRGLLRDMLKEFKHYNHSQAA